MEFPTDLPGGADPLRPHSHDNNPEPPDEDSTLRLVGPAGEETHVELAALLADFPRAVIPAYTYTTDHGRHGPYRLEGVSLRDFIERLHGLNGWHSVAVISADGFGNRVNRAEILAVKGDPILLCTHAGGEVLPRRFGLVRLVVPSETDNALRQIKWVRWIRLAAQSTAR